MFARLKIYYTVWLITALNAVQETFIGRWTNSLFFIGKAIRLVMSLVFLLLLRQTTKGFANYTTDEMVIFFLTYQFIDAISQIAYRGVYNFSNKVKSGEFDFLLAKPLSPLFRALTGNPDINDAVFLIPTLFVSFYIASQLQITVTAVSILWYVILLINAFLIATALHILVLTIAIITTEVDGVIWMYRDMISLGRFPVSIYQEPLRFILFFILPIGMMVTIPAEALLNAPTTFSIFITLGVGIGSVFISLQLWNWALKQYSSASS